VKARQKLVKKERDRDRDLITNFPIHNGNYISITASADLILQTEKRLPSHYEKLEVSRVKFITPFYACLNRL